MDRRKDVAVALTIAAAGLTLVILARRLPEGSIRDPLGTAAMPTAVGALLFAGGVLLALRRVIRWRGTGTDVAAEGAQDVPGYRASTLRAMVVWGTCTVYALLLQIVGFVLLTPVFLAFLLWALDVRRPRRLLVIAVVATGVMWLLFSVVLGVRLPEGPLQGWLV